MIIDDSIKSNPVPICKSKRVVIDVKVNDIYVNRDNYFTFYILQSKALVYKDWLWRRRQKLEFHAADSAQYECNYGWDRNLCNNNQNSFVLHFTFHPKISFDFIKVCICQTGDRGYADIDVRISLMDIQCEYN